MVRYIKARELFLKWISSMCCIIYVVHMVLPMTGTRGVTIDKNHIYFIAWKTYISLL
jgi:hypothetical protein